MIKISWFLALLVTLQIGSLAQTTPISLDLPKAEALFIKNNYSLLASNYQLDLAKADIITARLFENPQLEYENLFFNHETGKFLQTSAANGQFAGSISQLFKLAGKRNKQIKLAESNVKIAEHQYFDLMRSLKFELQRTFYQIYFNEQTLKVYGEQISATQQLLVAYQAQATAGNIAPKELIRIQSLLVQLKAEQTDLRNVLEDDYLILRQLCALDPATPITLTLSEQLTTDLKVDQTTYLALLDTAKHARADLQLAKAALQYNEANLQLQKAMAIPDIEIGVSYDYKGNFPEKYTGLGIKIPIPLFNRNQGEIKKARIGISAASLQIQQQALAINTEILNSYQTALRNEHLFNEIDPGFNTAFAALIAGAVENLKTRNISLIEFLDLYTAFKENTIQFNKIRFERMTSRAELNYVTGTNIFK